MVPMIHIDISDVAQWDAHTDWLSNPAEEYDLFRDGIILDFSVQEPGRGMKWSRKFRNPINLSGTTYAVVEYRADFLGP